MHSWGMKNYGAGDLVHNTVHILIVYPLSPAQPSGMNHSPCHAMHICCRSPSPYIPHRAVDGAVFVPRWQPFFFVPVSGAAPTAMSWAGTVTWRPSSLAPLPSSLDGST